MKNIIFPLFFLALFTCKVRAQSDASLTAVYLNYLPASMDTYWFDSDTLDYTFQLAYSALNPLVTAAFPTDNNATVQITQDQFSIDTTTIFVLSADSSTSRTYRIAWEHDPPSSDISMTILDTNLVCGPYNPDTTSYTLFVDSGTIGIPTFPFFIQGIYVTVTISNVTFPLATCDYHIIEACAEDGITCLSYTVYYSPDCSFQCGPDYNNTEVNLLDGLNGTWCWDFSNTISQYQLFVQFPFTSIENYISTVDPDASFVILPNSIPGASFEVEITSENGLHTRIISIELVDFCVPIGIEESEQQLIIMYPNPVKDLLYFNLPIEISKIQLMDMSGRILLEQTIAEQQNSIDITSLPQGVYIARLLGGEFMETYKISKL